MFYGQKCRVSNNPPNHVLSPFENRTKKVSKKSNGQMVKVKWSNGQNVYNCQMVWFSNGGLKTGQKIMFHGQ